MTRASFAWAAGAIALTALVLRVAYVLALGSHPSLGFDGTWYSLQAGTIADGVGFVDPNRYYGFRGAAPTAQFPPLWPGLLAVVHELGFGTARAYRITGGVVGSITVLLTAYLGRSVIGARAGLVAAGLVAISPLMIAADGSLMAESLFIALVTGAVLVAVHARRHPRPGWFALLGLLLGLATLARSDGILVAVVLAGVTAGCAPGSATRRLGLAAAALVAVVIVLTPWTVRNADAFGEAIPFSNNSGTLLSGANCTDTYSGGELAGWSARCAVDPDASSGGKREVKLSDVGRSKGLTYARKHVGGLVLVAPLRVVRGWGLWSPTALADAEVTESRLRAMQLIAWPASLALFGFAAVGSVLLVRSRGWTTAAPLLAVVGASGLILAASWGNQRFRLVAEPELAVFASVALIAGWRRVTRRSPA